MSYEKTESGILVPKQIDGLTNVVSGLGTAKSKREHNQWHYGMMNDWQTLDACYQTNWIARAIVDEWAADMTREWRSIKSEGAEAIEAEEQRLNVCQHSQEAIGWARLYGGAGVVMMTNQDLEKPLNLSKIGNGDLETLLVFDRYDLTGYGNINTWDMMAKNYLKYEFYTLSGGAQKIHHSHIAFFNGAKLPKRQARVNQGWGDSELRRCIEEITDMVSAKNGVAELLQEANIDVITRTGLSDELASDEDDAITKRYALYSQMKSIVNMALLDGDEKFERLTLQLGGVAQVIETFMVWISGAARMPMTKIFGTAASGLNATGEGDKKNYYDSIRAQQKGDFAISMRQIDEVLVRSALGSFPKTFDYVWNPLEQLDSVQVAQAQALSMQKHQMALQNNLATKSQVMRVLQSNEEYQYNDDKLEELEELENASLFDEPVDLEPEENPVEPLQV